MYIRTTQFSHQYLRFIFEIYSLRIIFIILILKTIKWLNCFSNTSQTKTLVIIKCQFSKFQSFRAKIFEMNCFCNYEAIVKCHKFTMSDAFFEDYPIYFLAPANKKYTLIIMRLGDEGADSNKSRRLEVINIQYSWRLHAISASSEWYSWLEVPISLYRKLCYVYFDENVK